MQKFKFNETIFYDNGKEYHLAYFLHENKTTCLIDVRVGFIHEPKVVSKSHIFKYSDELADKLTKKYGYEKRISKTF